ncbi:MAG: hypothetical protein PF961_02610, partial [Planctomycetota bacterium]|nr:hypothetical protein [Planctomycetota bacterium]
QLLASLGLTPGEPAALVETAAASAPLDEPTPTSQEAEPDQEDAEEDEEAAPEPVDWEAFAASEHAAALPEDLRTMATQLGPMLEQLTMQAAQLPLTAVTGQEIAGLLLQVLPQAAPPQVVQAVLSPQGINGLQAVCRYLADTGLAENGDDMVEGIKMVRQAMREQVRATGMLGGPDYSDPDEAEADADA